jgi:hypothetical protein
MPTGPFPDPPPAAAPLPSTDIPAIQPFWKAVLGYVDELGGDGPSCAIVDPAGSGRRKSGRIADTRCPR